MNYSFITMWFTEDGKYHSNTADYADYDTALGNFHAKFKPMQNDENVTSFTLVILDSDGTRKKLEKWSRPMPVEEPTDEIAE